MLRNLNNRSNGVCLAQESEFILCVIEILYTRKQNSLWAEGDVFQEKMLNERENGKMAVTRILSGVDDISINGSNKNRAPKKEEMELVSFDMMFCCQVWILLHYFWARTHPPLCLYIAFCLLYSIMMRRSETVLHREINCVPWRVRGRPDRPQVHYRKFPDSLQFPSCIMPTCCSSVHEQCLSFSVPWIISHTQYIYIRISKWPGIGYFVFCYSYDLRWAFSFPQCLFRVVSCPFVSGCVSMAKPLGLCCLHTMAIFILYIYNLRNQPVFLSILLICNMYLLYVILEFLFL